MLGHLKPHTTYTLIRKFNCLEIQQNYNALMAVNGN